VPHAKLLRKERAVNPDERLLCRVDAVPPGRLVQVNAASGEAWCVARDGDEWFACQASCPHQGVPLCEAHLEGGVLTCLEHLWQWDLRRGGVPLGRAEQPLRVIPLQRVGDDLLLVQPKVVTA
jgi:toluene monooxygenase system ferredoxin subunit